MSATENVSQQLVIRGRSIREDQGGHICLDDIWTASGAADSRKPKHWRKLAPSKRLELELLKKVRISDLKGDSPFKPVAYSKRDRGNTGTYAHPIIAAAYAGYLSPKLKIEVLEVWLRYRQGDPTLADDILQRATPVANLWAAVRAMGRSKRITYTDTLQIHGVNGVGYPRCTDAIYEQILGGPARRVKAKLGLPKKINLRDHLDTDELSFITAAEVLATERIREESPYGNDECVRASTRSAGFIREAIERDRKDRQPRLPTTIKPSTAA